jgi:hypothetical protein
MGGVSVTRGIVLQANSRGSPILSLKPRERLELSAEVPILKAIADKVGAGGKVDGSSVVFLDGFTNCLSVVGDSVAFGSVLSFDIDGDGFWEEFIAGDGVHTFKKE